MTGTSEPDRVIPGNEIFLALLRQQCLTNAGLLRGGLAVWCIGLLILPVFNHPGWILAFGLLFGAMLASALGGRDVLEGSEEFEFALPVSRAEHYLSRWAVGFATVTLLCGVGVLAVAVDTPQRLWKLVVDSGFTEPNPPVERPFIYGLAVLLPMATYCCTFAFAAASASRKNVTLSWLFGVLTTGLTTGLGIWAEVWQGGRGSAPTGRIVLPALLAVLVAGQVLGLCLYRRKEPATDGNQTGAFALRWLWLPLILIGILFLLLLTAVRA